jgi:hypothetical protein
MSKKNQVTIRGKTYDLDDAADLVSIQNALVPDNWPIKKADAVRLFLSLQNMLALQLKRHLAANFKGLIKAAIEEGEEAGAAKIGASFAFEIDVTAPQVAALTKLKLSFSVKHGTEGKPQTHDLTQGEFLDDDLSVVFDVKSLEKEKDEKPAPANEPPPIPADPLAGGDVTAENLPGDAPKVDKPRRGAKK